MISGGIEIITSRNIDSRMSYIIGIKQKEVFVFDESDMTLDKLRQFLISKSRSWGIHAELVDRSISSTKQVIDHIREAKLHESNIKIEIEYYQIDLRIEISYQGELLSLPKVNMESESYVEEEAFAHGLADFLTGVYPDRYQVSSKKNNSKISMFFNV